MVRARARPVNPDLVLHVGITGLAVLCILSFWLLQRVDDQEQFDLVMMLFLGYVTVLLVYTLLLFRYRRLKSRKA